MKAIRIYLDNIVELRKFEGALNFVGVPYTINEELCEIEVTCTDLEKRPDLKIEVSSGSAAVTFRELKPAA